MASKCNHAGLCLDRRQLNERPVRLGVRGVVRGLIMVRSADLVMGEGRRIRIIIC